MLALVSTADMNATQYVALGCRSSVLPVMRSPVLARTEAQARSCNTASLWAADRPGTRVPDALDMRCTSPAQHKTVAHQKVGHRASTVLHPGTEGSVHFQSLCCWSLHDMPTVSIVQHAAKRQWLC